MILNPIIAMLKEIRILVMKYSSIAAILENLKIYTTLNIIISAKDKIKYRPNVSSPR